MRHLPLTSRRSSDFNANDWGKVATGFKHGDCRYFPAGLSHGTCSRTCGERDADGTACLWGRKREASA